MAFAVAFAVVEEEQPSAEGVQNFLVAQEAEVRQQLDSVAVDEQVGGSLAEEALVGPQQAAVRC